MATDENDSLGEFLKEINKDNINNKKDIRRQIVYDEATGDFIVKDSSTPLQEGTQDATSFAREGFA